MLRGVYSLASAMDVAATNHELVAENLAHVNSPGYRRQSMQFESYAPAMAAGTSPQAGDGITNVRSGGVYTQFDSGPLQQTGNPLDVALGGDGFFVMQGPRGPLYSRNGAFELGPGNQLVSRSGLPVLAGGGPVSLPENAGSIQIGHDGTISVDGTPLAKLDVVTFDRPDSLRRAGDTAFEGGNPVPAADGRVTVEQGFREGSNVNVVNEMVSMMLGMRHYEAAEKTLKSISDAIAQQTRPQ
jgi:flagellar basal body rod protein FlgG